MEIIINEIMQALEITDIKYLFAFIGIVFGSLIVWRLAR